MKTLYVTDLDGTLLDSNSSLSKYTIETINDLINNGMCFTYATARSIVSASVVTKGLITNLPIITLNGTFLINGSTGEKLFSLYFTEKQKSNIIEILNKYSMFPLVHSYINEEEKVSWLKNKENEGIRNYLNSRKGDKRLRPVSKKEDLYCGEFFNLFFFGRKEELFDAYECFKNTEEFNCYFQQELCREEYLCEILPKNATKGNGIIKLQEMLKYDKIITFGDAMNDISMFEVSNESYAVDNAVDELKRIATGVIKSNDNNGVADWLKLNYT